MKQIMALIKDVPGFPKDGVLFRDITPVLQDASAFEDLIYEMGSIAEAYDVSKVVGVESRGFILGAPLATELRCGFVPVRKKRKLPRETWSESFSLEYGEEILEIHRDAIESGESVVIVDDVLATGGTAEAAAKLVGKCGGKVEAFVFMIEIAGLAGRKKLEGYNVHSLIQY